MSIELNVWLKYWYFFAKEKTTTYKMLLSSFLTLVILQRVFAPMRHCKGFKQFQTEDMESCLCSLTWVNVFSECRSSLSFPWWPRFTDSCLDVASHKIPVGQVSGSQRTQMARSNQDHSKEWRKYWESQGTGQSPKGKSSQAATTPRPKRDGANPRTFSHLKELP